MFYHQGFLAIAAVFGVIAYRVSVLAALQVLTKDKPTSTNSTLVALTTDTIYQNASLVTTVTAACINLLIIIILNMVNIPYSGFFFGEVQILAYFSGISKTAKINSAKINLRSIILWMKLR